MAISATVTRLRLRQHSFSEAVEAYSNGSFDLCASAAGAMESPEAAALLARSFLRLGRPQDAADVVDAALAAGFKLSHLAMGELLTHRATAHCRLSGPDADVVSLFSEPRIYVYAAASAALEAEFLTREAYAHLMVGDQLSAEKAARAALDVQVAFGEPAYLSTVEHSRARAYDILSFLAARREDYVTQKECLRSAIEVCDAASSRDAVLEANLLSNLSLFCVDFGDDGSIRERLNRMPEFDWLCPQRYEILRSLAWANALRGDNLGAFRDLREASEAATTIPRKMRATLDRAYFARQLKQDITAREELDFAERLSTRVNWQEAVLDEGDLAALAFLSQELAFAAPLRARRLFDRYKSLRLKLPPRFLATLDRRARAEEITVDAIISRAEGNIDRALELFRSAFETWDGLGYSVRAALVAKELASMGAGTFFNEYAAREACLRPRSWFAPSAR